MPAKKKDALEPLDIEPSKVLAIVAHPDDMEYGAAAVVAKWTAAGVEVVYLIASRGEVGIDDIPPDETALIRSGEQAAAAKHVGVDRVDFLDVSDGIIQNNLTLRRAITADIRHFQPDSIMVMNHHDIWQKGVRNSADHRAVGNAALDAVGDAANRWVFPDAGPPHRVESALVFGSPEATHAVDVSDHVEEAVSSFLAHEEYLAGLGDSPMASDGWLRIMLATTGIRLAGAKAAVAFEVFRFA